MTAWAGDDDLDRERVAALAATNRRWGTWGADDERGALNFIGPDEVRRAAATVRKGAVFALSLPLASGNGVSMPTTSGRLSPLHFMTATGCDPDGVDLGGSARYTDDYIVMPLQSGTHWDALCHIYYDGHLYNGFPASAVDVQGAHRAGIDKVADGFVGRAVLLDVPRALGIDRLEPGVAITTEHLLLVEERQRVDIGEGDIVLVRTGHISAATVSGDWTSLQGPQAGLHFETAGWIAERRIAALAADNRALEVTRQGAELRVPLHMLLLRDMGVHIGEYWFLDALAADCDDDGSYECLLVAAPLPVTGAAGAPVNPIAIK